MLALSRAAMRAGLFACTALVLSSAAALAENNNPTRVRIDYDPATGQPTCTVVSSSDGTAAGTKIQCPPAVLARTSTPGNASGTTDAGNHTGSTSNNSGDGQSGTSTTNAGSASSNSNTDNEGRGHGPVTVAGALNGGANAFSVVRLANFGNTAGTANIAIINPATGQTLANWSSAEVPSHGSLQSSLAAIVTAATLEPTVTTVPAVVDLRISATFRGTAQHLIGSGADGILTDASACGRDVTAPRERIGFVPTDTAASQSGLRIVNTNTAATTMAAVIRNAATGATVATWTSPSVAGGGSLTVPVATIRTEAIVDPTLAAVVIDTDHLAEGLRLELVVINTTGAVADQTISCGL